MNSTNNYNIDANVVEQKINGILEVLKSKKVSAEEIENQFTLQVMPYEIIRKLIAVLDINAKIENSKLVFYISKHKEAEQLSIF